MELTTFSNPLSLVVVVGSNRSGRVAPAVARWVTDLLTANADFDTRVIDIAELDLPLQEVQPGGSRKSPVSELMFAADAFLLITPEYNHSFPAALKNFIDWHFEEWAFKPVAFVSYGASSGGIRSVEQLRLIFPELNAVTIRSTVSLESPWKSLASGRLEAGTRAEQSLSRILAELTWWGSALRAQRISQPFGAA